jgi:hypothetical protein
VFILCDQAKDATPSPSTGVPTGLGERLKRALDCSPPITGSAAHVDMPPLKISTLPLDHSFLVKKPVRDEVSHRLIVTSFFLFFCVGFVFGMHKI